jgi:hypothetical protein
MRPAHVGQRLRDFSARLGDRRGPVACSNSLHSVGGPSIPAVSRPLSPRARLIQYRTLLSRAHCAELVRCLPTVRWIPAIVPGSHGSLCALGDVGRFDATAEWLKKSMETAIQHRVRTPKKVGPGAIGTAHRSSKYVEALVVGFGRRIAGSQRRLPLGRCRDWRGVPLEARTVTLQAYPILKPHCPFAISISQARNSRIGRDGPAAGLRS